MNRKLLPGQRIIYLSVESDSRTGLDLPIVAFSAPNWASGRAWVCCVAFTEPISAYGRAWVCREAITEPKVSLNHIYILDDTLG